MNGEKFKNFLSGDINVVGINIYAKTSETEGDELFLLKSLKEEQIKKEGTEFFNEPQDKIIDILKSFKEKVFRCYDSHKSKDEIFYLNLVDLKQMEDLHTLIEEIREVNDKISEYTDYEKTIKMLIVEILTEPKHQILFFVKHKYSNILKKNFLLEFVGKGKFKFSNTKILILDFNPSGILFDDELLIVNGYFNHLFKFDIFFKEYIKANEDKVREVFHVTDKTFKTQAHSLYMARGIMSGGLDKYIGLSQVEKEEKLEKFKEAYKNKFKSDIKVNVEEGRIVMEDCSSKEKEEIIKCLTNKAAFKLLTDELTTSLD
jgi:hypothetical protein